MREPVWLACTPRPATGLASPRLSVLHNPHTRTLRAPRPGRDLARPARTRVRRREVLLRPVAGWGGLSTAAALGQSLQGLQGAVPGFQLLSIPRTIQAAGGPFPEETLKDGRKATLELAL